MQLAGPPSARATQLRGYSWILTPWDGLGSSILIYHGDYRLLLVDSEIVVRDVGHENRLHRRDSLSCCTLLGESFMKITTRFGTPFSYHRCCCTPSSLAVLVALAPHSYHSDKNPQSSFMMMWRQRQPQPQHQHQHQRQYQYTSTSTSTSASKLSLLLKNEIRFDQRGRQN